MCLCSDLSLSSKIALLAIASQDLIGLNQSVSDEGVVQIRRASWKALRMVINDVDEEAFENEVDMLQRKNADNTYIQVLEKGLNNNVIRLIF